VNYRCTTALVVMTAIFVTISAARAEGDEGQPNRIRIEYGEARTEAQKTLLALMQEHGALERFQRIFSPFRLPIEVTLRVQDCGGVSNAWYQRPVVTICYEYVDELRNNIPTREDPGEPIFGSITPRDAMFGQFLYAVAHEMGHAVFDLLDVPIFGRAEDAADGFAGYMILELGKEEVKRIVLGAAFSYKKYVKNPRVCVPLGAFADGHAAPMQRFYNLLCIGYGAAPELFSDLVEKGYLPQSRANGCRMEYNEVNFAFHKSLAPYIDAEVAKGVLDKTWLPPVDPTPQPSVSLRPPQSLTAELKQCSNRPE
jgi:Putative metallopeptidase